MGFYKQRFYKQYQAEILQENPEPSPSLPSLHYEDYLKKHKTFQILNDETVIEVNKWWNYNWSE